MYYFTKKLEDIARLKQELECVIWPVFHKFIGVLSIYFPEPKTWYYEYGSIIIKGKNTCGADTYLPIPLKYFTDTEEAFTKLEKWRN